MSDPDRILDGGGIDALEEHLIRSAREEQPGRDARRKALVAMGLVGAGVSGITTATVAAAGSSGLAGGSTAAGSAAAAGASVAGGAGASVAVGAASALSLAKWAGAGMLAGVLALGVEPIARRVASPERTEVAPQNVPDGPSRVLHVRAPSVGERRAAPALAEPASAPETEDDRTLPSTAGSSRTAVNPIEPAIEPIGIESAAHPSNRESRLRRAAPPPDPAVAPLAVADDLPQPRAIEPAGSAFAASLRGELALLESARNALAAGDVGGAEAALTRYRTDHPAGAMQVEAEVLQIQMLLARGDRSGATALSHRLLIEHPGSPYADRVRALLSAAEAETKR